MTQTTFPALPIVSGETREGKLYLKYADGTEIMAGEVGKEITKEDVTGALGYEPAGGKNLILDSGVEITSSDYLMHTYDLSEPVMLNTPYTITVWGDSGEEGQLFTAFAGLTGNNHLETMSKIKDGVYSATRTLTQWTVEGDDASKLQIFNYPQNPLNTSSIHKVKLERGTATDPIWTPAPEDVVVQSQFDELVKRVAALEQAG